MSFLQEKTNKTKKKHLTQRISKVLCCGQSVSLWLLPPFAFSTWNVTFMIGASLCFCQLKGNVHSHCLSLHAKHNHGENHFVQIIQPATLQSTHEYTRARTQPHKRTPNQPHTHKLPKRREKKKARVLIPPPWADAHTATVHNPTSVTERLYLLFLVNYSEVCSQMDEIVSVQLFPCICVRPGITYTVDWTLKRTSLFPLT